jgi:hypothetical protein
MTSDTLGTVYGVVGCVTVIEWLEKEVVVGCINGIPYVDRFCPAAIPILFGVKDVISSHVVMAIGAEEKGLPILTDIGRLLVVAGVDSGSQVYGNSPLPVRLTLRQIDIKSALCALPITGKIEGLSVFAETGMGFPVFGGYVFTHSGGRRPQSIFKPAVIEVADVIVIVIEDHFGPIVR